MKTIILFSVLLLFTANAPAQDRKIEAGDDIEIIVYGHQELSRVVRVSDKGTIDFPFMQSLPVDGLSLERLKEILVAQLSRYLDTYPVVTVSLKEDQTMDVSVLGMVNKPGIVRVPEKTTLQAAIAAAGGLVPGARYTEITLMRRQEGQVVRQQYNLEEFLLKGELKENPVLQTDDVIMITGNPVFSQVKVVGQVNSPGTFDAYSGATVLDMILMAGGPTEDADLSRVRYVSPSRKRSVEFNLDMEKILTSADVYNLPAVKAGDVIAIPKKKNYWSIAINAIRDVSYVALAVYYIARIND